MQPRKHKLVLGATITILALLACNLPQPASTVKTATPAGDVVISENTVIFSTSDLDDLLSVSPDGIVFTFNSSSDAASSLQVGDIIVGGVSDAAPDGFLRQVIAVQESGGQIAVATEFAALEDAIVEGSLSESVTLTPSGVAGLPLADGVSLAPLGGPRLAAASRIEPFRLKLENVVLYDQDGILATTNDQVIANGDVIFRPDVNLDISIHHNQLDNFLVSVSMEREVNVTLVSRMESPSIGVVKDLMVFPIPHITFLIGVVPVVVKPTIPVSLSLDGQLESTSSMGMSETTTLLGGLKLQSGSVTPIADFDRDFSVTPPQVQVKLTTQLTLAVALDLKFYGVAGPKVSIGIYLRVVGDLLQIPCIAVYLGLEVDVALEAEILGRVLAGVEATVIDDPHAVDISALNLCRATPTPTGSAPPPTRTPTSIPTRTATLPGLGVYYPVAGCAPSQIHVGDTVALAPGISNLFIRSSPDTHPSDNIIRQFLPGEVALVTGAAVCNYGWLLWPILAGDGTTGWIAETDGSSFWLVPTTQRMPTQGVPTQGVAYTQTAAVLGTGDVQVTLSWWSHNDLDLWVTDPYGEKIYFGNQYSDSGGELDLDANPACANLTDYPIENIFWSSGGAPSGSYTIQVNYYEQCTTTASTPYHVRLLVDGRVYEYDGVLTFDNETQTVTTFSR